MKIEHNTFLMKNISVVLLHRFINYNILHRLNTGIQYAKIKHPRTLDNVITKYVI